MCQCLCYSGQCVMWLISVLKDVKRDCNCFLIQKRLHRFCFLKIFFLLKLRLLLKLSLSTPGLQLILLQSEVENYVQNEGKIDLKTR